MKTDWRPVPDFPGYEVSNTGKVRSLPRPVLRNGKTTRLVRNCILRPSRTSNGSAQVVLSHAGRKKSFRVHHLVARVFHGECPKGERVIFKNGDYQDLRASNLTYGRPDPTDHILAAMERLMARMPPGQSLVQPEAV